MGGTIFSLALSLGFGCSVAVGSAAAQASNGNGHAHHAKKRSHRRATVDSSAIPVIATPGVAVISTEAQRRAADQRLLQQQQAASAEAQKITDQQVKAAQKQHDQLQNEPRIQDAPGPAQTGVVPAAGAPTAPVSSDQRIQDAPGPAQTLPPIASPTPAQPGTVPPVGTPPRF